MPKTSGDRPRRCGHVVELTGGVVLYPGPDPHAYLVHQAQQVGLPWSRG
jgi:hypothetical protein